MSCSGGGGGRRKAVPLASTRRLMMTMSFTVVVVAVLFLPPFSVVQAFSTTSTTPHRHHHGPTGRRARFIPRDEHRMPMTTTTSLSFLWQNEAAMMMMEHPQQQPPEGSSRTALSASRPSSRHHQQQPDTKSITLLSEEKEIYATGLTVAALILIWSIFAAHTSHFLITLVLSLVAGGAAGYASSSSSSADFGMVSFVLRAMGLVSLQGVDLFQERIVPRLQEVMTTPLPKMRTLSEKLALARDEPNQDDAATVVVAEQTLSLELEPGKDSSIQQDGEPEQSNVIVEQQPLLSAMELEQEESSNRDDEPKTVVVEQKKPALSSLELDQQTVNVIAVPVQEPPQQQQQQPKLLSALEMKQEKQTSSRVPDTTILGAAVTTSLLTWAVSDANVLVSSILGITAAYATILLPPSNPVGSVLRTTGQVAVETVSFGTEWVDRATQTLNVEWQDYQQRELEKDKSASSSSAAAVQLDALWSEFSSTMTSAWHGWKESWDSTIAKKFPKNNKNGINNKPPSFFIDELSVDKSVVQQQKGQSVTSVKTAASTSTTTAPVMPLFFAMKQKQEQEAAAAVLTAAARNEATALETGTVAGSVAAKEVNTKEVNTKEETVVVMESSKAPQTKKGAREKTESNAGTTRAATAGTTAQESMVASSATTTATAASPPKKQQPQRKATRSDYSVQQDELTRRALLAYRLTLQAREQKNQSVAAAQGAAVAAASAWEESFQEIPVAFAAAKAPTAVEQQASLPPSTATKERDVDAKVQAAPTATKTAQQQKKDTLDYKQPRDERTRRALLAYRLTLEASIREQQHQSAGAKSTRPSAAAVEKKSRIPIATPAAEETKLVVMQTPSRVARQEKDMDTGKSTVRTTAATEQQNEIARRALLAYRLRLQNAAATVERSSKNPTGPVAIAQEVVLMASSSATKEKYTNVESTVRTTVASEKQNEMARRTLLTYRLTLQANYRATAQAAVKEPEFSAAASTTAQEDVKQALSPPTGAKEKDTNKESEARTAAAEKQNEMNRRALLAYRLALQANEQKQQDMAARPAKKSRVSKASAAKSQVVDRAAPGPEPTIELEETVMTEPDVVVSVALPETMGAIEREDANGKLNGQVLESLYKEESTGPIEPATTHAPSVEHYVSSPMAAAKLQEISAILESARDTGSVPASTQLEVVDAILTEFPEDDEEEAEWSNNGAAVSPESALLDQISSIIFQGRNAGPDNGAAEAQLQEINAILATAMIRATNSANTAVDSPCEEGGSLQQQANVGTLPKVKGKSRKSSSSKSPKNKKKTKKNMNMSSP